MIRALPAATIEKDLRQRVADLLVRSTHYADSNTFEVKALLKDADKLTNAVPFAGSLIKAEVHHVCGDVEGFRYWISNARKLGGALHADQSEMIGLGNLGFFSEAAPLYKKVASVPTGQLGTVFGLGLLLTSFAHMIKAAQAAELAQLQLEGIEGLPLAQKGAAIMTKLELEESQVQAVLDVAGEVLRKHRMFWQQSAPEIRVVDNADGASMLYQLYIGASAQEACRLTDEVIDLMVLRDIDAPGVAFSFLPLEA